MKWEIEMTSCPVSLCGAILCVVSCLFKMALCQYPCPEEIDVFTGPHMRMKQLVYETLEKVRSLYLRELLMGSFCAGTHPQALQRISLLLDSTSLQPKRRVLFLSFIKSLHRDLNLKVLFHDCC